MGNLVCVKLYWKSGFLGTSFATVIWFDFIQDFIYKIISCEILTLYLIYVNCYTWGPFWSTLIPYCEGPTTWTNYLYRHQSKMSSSKKIYLYGRCGRCLSEFIDWRFSQSCWYFRPSFGTIAPLTFSLVLLLPPPFPVWISILYTRIQCVRGGGGYGQWWANTLT